MVLWSPRFVLAGWPCRQALMPELARGFAMLFVFLCGFVAGRTHKFLPDPSMGRPALHWNPNIERRGLGDLLQSLNHVALIVSDVGRSLAFYVEVLGFQQIERPNFDRHGAWLTMGNVELHLIKGIPVVPSGEDLIVSHMALECDHPQLVLEKLLEMDVPFRQNISVPDPQRARENKVESFDNSDGKVTQYFVRDPDGYYFEICNCDILTKFVLGGADQIHLHLSGYMEGALSLSPMMFKIGYVIKKAVRRARMNLLIPIDDRVRDALKDVTVAESADLDLLTRMTIRQKTYSDITQGFSQAELIDVLKSSGNHIPTALLILEYLRGNTTVMLTPTYFVNDGGDVNFEGNKVRQHVVRSQRQTPVLNKLGTADMYLGKSFKDNEPSIPPSSLQCQASIVQKKARRAVTCTREDDHLSVADKLAFLSGPACNTHSISSEENFATGHKQGRKS